jgi:hypothetical protein
LHAGYAEKIHGPPSDCDFHIDLWRANLILVKAGLKSWGGNIEFKKPAIATGFHYATTF